MRLSFVFPALTAVLIAPCAAGQEIGNAGRGKALAAQFCAECHNTQNNEEASPDPKATPFAVVANTKGMTGMALSVWMQTSHPTMPGIRLKPDTTDDIIAYILSLKTRKTGNVPGDTADDIRQIVFAR